MVVEILRNLYYRPMQPIADIANSLSRSIPSVTKQINELLSKNIVVEKGYAASTGGRKAMQYMINEDLSYTIVSLSIDQFYTAITLSNLKGDIISSLENLPVDLRDSDAANVLLKTVDRFFSLNNIDLKQVIGIGISMPGFVNSETGLNESYNSDSALYNIKELIEQKFNVPAVIDNDSRCVAWAEKKFGNAQDSSHSLVINLNWGVGLGILINDDIFKGTSGFAGEFSHIPLSDELTLCSCGKRGCLEVEASVSAAIRNIEKDIKNGEYSIYEKLVEEYDNKAEALIESVQIGDQIAINNIGKIGYLLGKGISTLIHILNPNKIIISGRGAEIGYILAPHIQVAVNEYSIPKISKKTSIEISDLHKRAQQLGTTALVIEKYITNIIN
ncbi:ROK family transcriptional regulator [Sphingobacterium multivorum]|uniref:Making large colonies protein n=2 Tax=Sphingobacteriaceae TaxID=84566 RepID=A0A654BXT5_SPHMU|nr:MULTISPECIES: ROK family transcriptional regulator [Sphingobacterium]SUJ10396.1 Making large colonies protein [Sphingobacterium multivorum]VXC85611.1 Making large colonies protein [Sphingobacterium multivorum]HAK28402.1 ROK family protein [Sphingobacterium sp.]